MDLSEMSLQEMREKRAALVDNLYSLSEKTGTWSQTDQEKFNSMEKQVRALDVALRNYEDTLQSAAAGFDAGRSLSAPRGPFQSLGEQLRAVALASQPGGRVDERLHQVNNMQESIPSEGGFAVQTDFSDQLLREAFEESILPTLCNKLTISTGANSIFLPAVDETSRANGSRWGGVTSAWAAEGETLNLSEPKLRAMKLELKKLGALCRVSNELIEDMPLLGQVVKQAFSDEFDFRVSDAIFRGLGAGQPLGFLNSGSLVTVSKEAGQANDTILYENTLAMFSRMPARNRRRGIWIVNQEIEPQLFTMSLTVGTSGVAVYMPAGGASGAPYATLFNRPVIPAEQAAALGDVGDISFVDLGSYVLVDKGAMKTAQSMHVYFDSDRTAFRFVYRVDGQPSWASPLTPYKGANTLSPFICLEAR